MKYKEYIPSPQHWKDMYAQYPAMYRVIGKIADRGYTTKKIVERS